MSKSFTVAELATIRRADNGQWIAEINLGELGSDPVRAKCGTKGDAIRELRARIVRIKKQQWAALKARVKNDAIRMGVSGRRRGPA